MKIIRPLLLPLLLFPVMTMAQNKAEDKGSFSGNFTTTNQFYVRDSSIGATTTQYQHEKSSTDAWLFLNYQIRGFSVGMRYDVFNNSPLLNPQQAYTNHGIGYWSITKTIENFDVTIGSFYDQFGSGMVFRAYEDRNLGIDYAIQGARLRYHWGDKLRLKAFTGNQKGNISNRFGTAPQVVKGFNAESSVDLFKGKFRIQPGGSIVNRTLDPSTMQLVADQINSYPLADKFNPKWNTYVYNGYANFSLGDFGLNLEYVGKTREAIKLANGQLINRAGNVRYATLTWSKTDIGKLGSSIGANLQYKRIDHYQFRTSPFETLLNGLVTYLPSVTRQNTYRLLARYNSVVQELGETAIQGDLLFTLKHGTYLTVNVSHVESLPENGFNGKKILLFEEQYVELNHKFNKTFKAKLGLQRIFYNQERYEQKAGYQHVKTITPFGEFLYKFTKKKSLRLEWQYLKTKQDLGEFANVLLEYSISPHWTFSAGDMLNINPYRQPGSNVALEKIHYYSFFAGYTYKSTVITAAYIKQLQGVNCSGGICRVEPAFSGLRLTLNTNF